MSSIGILAYGSLVNAPGDEIAPNIKSRIKTATPFPVEYGRYSGKTRGGAPTVVPYDQGAPVEAEVLILDDHVSFEEARNRLWRRETGTAIAHAVRETPRSNMCELSSQSYPERIARHDCLRRCTDA